MSPAKADEAEYRQLSHREHILLRPDTYLGAETGSKPMWVVEQMFPTIQFDRHTVTYVPAFLQIIDEILVNAADNKQRDRSMTKIEVRVCRSSGRISVMNNGRGIEQGMATLAESGAKVPIPEFIFGNLLTSSHYNDEQNRVTGGKNGYGAKLTNIFSVEFDIETICSKTRYVQHWRKNMSEVDRPIITPDKGADFTRVTFLPDYVHLRMVDENGRFQGLDDEQIGLIRRRVCDIQAVNPDIKVYYAEVEESNFFDEPVKKVPISSFADYALRFLALINAQNAPAQAESTVQSEQQSEEEGAAEESPAQQLAPLVTYSIQDKSKRVWWEVIIGPSDGKSFQHQSFVNSIYTPYGGTHVDYITQQAVKLLKDNTLVKKLMLPDTDIKRCLFVMVRCLVVNPGFESQTKDTLTTSAKMFGGKDHNGGPDGGDNVCVLPKEIFRDIANTQLYQLLVSQSKTVENKLLSKMDGKKSVNVDVPKLNDANWAGTARSHECTLILTEGDSAKGLADAGIAAMKMRDTFGAFPLRGKVLNVVRSSAEKTSANMELGYLKKILGLKQGVHFQTLQEAQKKLRYGHVMIMADQDTDGSHIKGLILNFFWKFWPELVRMGYIQEFVTPIIRVFNLTTRRLLFQFFTVPDYQRWLAERDGRTNGMLIKYYKGLGTSTKQDASAYFGDLELHRKLFIVDDRAEERLALAFTGERSDDRKRWLLEMDPNAFLDHTQSRISISDFVDKELVLYAYDNVLRSIPSMLDGLKPVQRKVLMYMLMKNIVTDQKVAQLQGKIAATMAYHHGDQSLVATIIAMAQDFVGANNVPLLMPEGVFGSRNAGGKDASAARYINTFLSPLARYFFPPEDDVILERLDDDGTVVEPKHFFPVVPFSLVNGAHGIATGWSTNVPSYDPFELVEAVRHMLRGYSCPRLTPYFYGHTVPPTRVSPTQFVSYGRIVFQDTDEPVNAESTQSLGEVATVRLRITELPFGKWTEPYKMFLQEHLASNVKARATKAPPAAKGAKGAKAKTAKTEEKPEKKPPAFVIQTIEEQHGVDTIDFRVTMTYAEFRKVADIDPTLMKPFDLAVPLRSNNIHLIADDGHVYHYNSVEDVMRDYFIVRLQAYCRRKASMERQIRLDLIRLTSRVTFIEAVVRPRDPLIVARRPTLDIVRDMWTKFRIVPDIKFAARVAIDTDNKLKAGMGYEGMTIEDAMDKLALRLETGHDDLFELAEKNQFDIDYERLQTEGYSDLLQLPIRSLTTERVEKIHQQLDEMRTALEELLQSDPSELWWRDLARLHLALTEYRARQDFIRAEQELQARGQKRKPRRGKAAISAAEPEAPHSAKPPLGSAIRLNDNEVQEQMESWEPREVVQDPTDLSLVEVMRNSMGARYGLIRAEAVLAGVSGKCEFRQLPLGDSEPKKKARAKKSAAEPEPPQEDQAQPGMAREPPEGDETKPVRKPRAPAKKAAAKKEPVAKKPEPAEEPAAEPDPFSSSLAARLKREPRVAPDKLAQMLDDSESGSEESSYESESEEENEESEWLPSD